MLEDDWDYNIQGDPPDGPLPEPPLPNEDNSDDEWLNVDEEAGTSGEVLYQHFLDGRGTNKKSSTSGSKEQQDYATRIANERKNWKDQEDELGKAFMEFRVSGAKLYEEGDDTDWFTCTLYDLTGTFYSVRWIYFSKILQEQEKRTCAIPRMGMRPSRS